MNTPYDDYETIDYDARERDLPLGDGVFADWKSENLSALEQEFIDTFPPEDRPLDDDGPDFLDNYSDEFDAYCREEFNKRDG